MSCWSYNFFRNNLFKPFLNPIGNERFDTARVQKLDLFFARVVTELHEAGMFDEPARTECLGGKLDYRTRATDRWVGGVLLSGSSCFRRDGSRIVPP